MAKAAWECADPGIQYDSTINDWHTCPESGRITASNPCFPADQRVVTDRGLIRIGDLVAAGGRRESFAVYTNDVTPRRTRGPGRRDDPDPVHGHRDERDRRAEVLRRLAAALHPRPPDLDRQPRLGACGGPDRRRQCRALAPVRPTPDGRSAIPGRGAGGWPGRRRHASRWTCPTKWDEEFAHYLGWLVGDGCVDRPGDAVTVYGIDEDAGGRPAAAPRAASRGSLDSRASRASRRTAPCSSGSPGDAFIAFLRGARRVVGAGAG